MLALGEVDKLVVSSSGENVFVYLHKDAVIPVSAACLLVQLGVTLLLGV